MSYVQPNPAVANGHWRIGDWNVDTVTDVITQGSEHIKLEPRTMKLLMKLAEHPGEVVSTQQLLDSVWAEVVVGPSSVYQAVSQLRKELHDTDPEPSYIATISRKGYRLIAPVAKVDASARAEATQSQVTAPDRRRWRRLAWSIVPVIGVLALIFIWRNAIWHSAPPREASRDAGSELMLPAIPTDARTLVVLPFNASDDESRRRFAPILTDLVRNRLAALPGIAVITGNSVAAALEKNPDPLGMAQRLHARYVMSGAVKHAEDTLEVDVHLLDTATGKDLWSLRSQQPVSKIAQMPDDVVQHTMQSLDVSSLDTAAAVGAAHPVDIEAYELYLHGQKLMATFRAEDADRATAIFSRVSTLDPSFARGYYSFGMALLLAADLGARDMTPDLRQEAGKAFDRAIELDPQLGEAWAQRGRLTGDPVQAEEFYRKALQLSPGYDESYGRFAEFLFTQRRRGEAIELMDRASRIDPMSPSIARIKSQIVLAAHGDVAGQQRLLRDSLEVLPNFPTALRDLAVSRWIYSGEEAEAIALVEKAKAADPGSDRADWIAVNIYLDIGDVQAARAVLRDSGRAESLESRAQWVAIKMFEADLAGAAALAREINRIGNADPGRMNSGPNARAYVVSQEVMSSYGMFSIALRDEAIAKRDFRTALELIGPQYEASSSVSPLRKRGLVLAYANTLMLAGQEQKGRSILESLLRSIDAESVGRPPWWFSWDRAAAHAMLGNVDEALGNLEESQRSGRYLQWWYISQRDPIFSSIRDQPRFRALVEQADRHRAAQRTLLEKMRNEGTVPRRS